MNSSSINFREVSRFTHGDGSVDITFGWDFPSLVNLADIDQMWFDVALESGFLYYLTQDFMTNPQHHNEHTVTFSRNTRCYVRINTHYRGFELIRGWYPSNTIDIVIGHPIPLTGQFYPATGLSLVHDNLGNGIDTLTWNSGYGDGLVNRVAVDFSYYADHHDQLSAPYEMPSFGNITIDELPYSVDMPVGARQLYIRNLPKDRPVYISINTLFNQSLWVPSENLSTNTNNTLPIILGGAILAIILARLI